MTEKLKKILSEIESGKRKNIYNLKLTKEELLSQDNNGITFLEHLLRKEISLFVMKEVIKNDIEIAKIFCECDKSLYMFEFDENTLFSVIDGQMFIEYLIEREKFVYTFVSSIKEKTEIIDILASYKKEYLLKNLTTELIEKLITKNNEGNYLIEKYLNNDSILENIIPLINDVNILMEICQKNNNYELLRYANENVLMTNYNDYVVLDYLINKNIIPKTLTHIPKNIEYIKFLLQNNYQQYLTKATEGIFALEIENDKTLLEVLVEQGYNPSLFKVWEEKTISILHKINRLDLVTNTMESFLIKPAREILNDDSITDNITFLEYMLNNNYNPLSNSFTITDDNVIRILYQKQRPDLLVKVEIEKLLNEIENNKTYLDYILESIKNNHVKTEVNKFVSSTRKIDILVRIYLIIANQDMMEYINELKEEDLLKKYGETTLLEELLRIDSNLTLNRILNNAVKSKPNIAAILKSKGLVQQQVDVVLKKEDFTSEYFQQEQSKLGIGPLMEEGEYLLNKLENLFLSDGKSDKNLITALITGYRQALFTNYEVNINEIKKLIQIKEENLDRFFYLKEENGAYFKPSNGSVFSDTIAVETLFHETGHALHYYLAKNEIIENYQEITKRIRKNSESLKKVEDYSNRYNYLWSETEKLVEQKYKEFFSL